MQSQTFNWEIEDMLQQFAAAFDDAIVNRYDGNRNITDKIQVRYLVAPKQRVWAYLNDAQQNIKLPVVSVMLNSMARDPNRVFNKLQGSTFSLRGGNAPTSDGHLLQPIPINLSVSVAILAKYQSDYEQILGNFIPNCDPYFIISWALPGAPGYELRSEVEWSGQVTITSPIDANAGTQWQFMAETAFTIKGWLFKQERGPVGKIFKIDHNFQTFKAISSGDDLSINTDTTESFSISAAPLIQFTNKYQIPANDNAELTLFGNALGYQSVSQMYLSGSTIPAMSAYDATGIFLGSQTEVPDLSSVNGAFYGAPVNFTINSVNSVTIHATSADAISAGYVDIIVSNPAGYSILSRDVINTTNLPAVSGIAVI